MKLHGVNSFEKLYNKPKTGNIRSTQSENRVRQLSQSEEHMINNQFPVKKSSRLEYYMSSGKTKVQHPSAKGANIDFKG